MTDLTVKTPRTTGTAVSRVSGDGDGRGSDGGGRGRAARLRRELRAIHALVHRDLLRLAGQRTHTALMLLHPVLYLLVLGGGLAALIPRSSLGVGYQTYLFPGDRKSVV